MPSHVIFTDEESEEETDDIPWSLHTYPLPDKRRFGKRRGVEYVTATERLFWRSDRRLAFRAGAEYPANIRDQLATLEELYPS